MHGHSQKPLVRSSRVHRPCLILSLVKSTQVYKSPESKTRTAHHDKDFLGTLHPQSQVLSRWTRSRRDRGLHHCIVGSGQHRIEI
uniref:Uncharacterized protein n=1 Tax=Rhipicephalus appendiculatus TaxID=34631 RepID=A0A131YDW1_RHIAP